MRRVKYGNRKVVVDGNVFDSRKEATRWRELRLLEATGDIKDLQRQVKFLLIPAQREKGTVGKRGGIKPGKIIERECAYIADFVYKTASGETIVEDTKGMRTPDYIIKRKLMLWVNDIRIREV